MEFPSDVLTLIREYAKPLPRRTISEYWVNEEPEGEIFTLEDMKNIVKGEFEMWLLGFDDYDEDHNYDEDHIDETFVNGIYTLSCNEMQVYFTIENLMKWNGKFEYDDDFKMMLEEDEKMYYQIYTTKWKILKIQYL